MKKCFFCYKRIWFPVISSSYHDKCWTKRLDELKKLALTIIWSDKDNNLKAKELDEIYSELDFLAKL